MKLEMINMIVTDFVIIKEYNTNWLFLLQFHYKRGIIMMSMN